MSDPQWKHSVCLSIQGLLQLNREQYPKWNRGIQKWSGRGYRSGAEGIYMYGLLHHNPRKKA